MGNLFRALRTPLRLPTAAEGIPSGKQPPVVPADRLRTAHDPHPGAPRAGILAGLPGTPAAPPEGGAAPRSARRAIAYGLAGVLLLCLITPYTDLVVRGSWIAHNCLPVGVLCLFLLLVTGINRLLGRFSARAMLSRAELLLVYAMMLVAAGIPSVGLTQVAVAMIAAPAHYANATNGWETTLLPLIPRWLRVSDEAALRAYFQGCRPGEPVPWGAWLAPLAAWMIYAVLLYAAFMFLVLLLHRPWVEHERLTFPLAQMPLEIVGRDPVPTGNRAFLRSGWMWAGLILVLGIHSLNSLHRMVPDIPAALPTMVPVGTALVQSPWRVLRNTRIYVHFSAIGLTYLLAGNVSLSLWVFWVLAKAQMVALTALGFEAPESRATVTLTPIWFLTMQMWGGLLAYGLYLVYDGYRTASRDRERRASGGKGGDLPPAASLAGFALCTLLLAGWHAAAGGAFLLQWAALVAWILSMLSLTRLVCAGGLILIDTNWLPMDILYRGLGQSFVRPGDLAVLTQNNTVFGYFPQLNMMPFLFNGLRVTDGEWRRVAVAAIAVAILVAIPASFASTLWLIHRHGAMRLNEWRLGIIARENLQTLAGYLQSPTDVQWHALGSMVLGAGVMMGLVSLQRNVTAWPLSPLGYLVGGNSTVMDRLWFCIFVGWATNALVRHYGGLRGYVRYRPFFLGLILGEFGAAALWLILDAALGVTDHSVFP
ncbi:MAG: hypothetical protein HY321_15530 [Armatimonadetes bacterium]|nr:hypothetical protein [Armatimonadota bacterium]